MAFSAFKRGLGVGLYHNYPAGVYLYNEIPVGGGDCYQASG